MSNLVEVSISIGDGGLISSGFNTAIFTSSHRYTKERVTVHNTLASLDGTYPTASNAYIGAQSYFSNENTTALKLGRREADLDLTVSVASTTASLTFSASDGTNDYTINISAAGINEDAVAADIQSQIESDINIGPLVTATVLANVVSITPATATDIFWIANLSDELSDTYTATETAVEMDLAIAAEDDEWVFIGCDDHTTAFQTAMMAQSEARSKLYVFSSEDLNTLTPYNAGTSTDSGAVNVTSAYKNVTGFFHDLADESYNEMYFIGTQIPYLAGSSAWAPKRVSISPSKDPNTGFLLNATQIGYLEDRNMSYVEQLQVGVNALRVGETGDGTSLEDRHGLLSLESDLNADLSNLILSQVGSKLAFIDEDITKIINTVKSSLNRYVDRKFIRKNFVLDFPLAADVSPADKQAGIYRGSFTAELGGKIAKIVITGTLVVTL